MTATKHYPVGGSTIERIELCPASRKAVAALPERPAGKAAERGTRIHSRAEEIFKGARSKTKYTADEDAVAKAMVAKLLEVAAELGFSKEELILEEQIAFKSIHPEDAGGTPDVAAHRAFHDLLIVDFKTGANFVSAERNIQLLFYGAAYFYEKLDPFTQATIGNIHCVILQPDLTDNTVIYARRWSMPASEMGYYKERFQQAVANSILRDWEFKPGNHCEDKYCDARATCAAYKEWLNKSTDGKLFDALEQAKKNTVAAVPRGEVLAELLKAKPLIEKWLKAAETAAIAEMTANAEAVPGFTLESKPGDRVWLDEEATEKAAAALGLSEDQYKPRKLISPAQFEKLKGITKEQVAELVTRPNGNPKPTQKQISNLADFAPPAPPAMPDFRSLA